MASARIRAIPKHNRRRVEATTRLHRMLEVARRMFIEHGFHHTSLDDILARSGGSKATLRKYFGNKAGLLAAILETTAEERVTEALSVSTSDEPEAALSAFGNAVLSFYLRPDALIIYRSVIAEGYKHPAVAKGLYYGGHARIVAALAEMLRRWHTAGAIRCTDPGGDAERFLNMLRSGPHERGLLGLESGFSPETIRLHVDAAVRIFLFGTNRSGKAARA